LSSARTISFFFFFFDATRQFFYPTEMSRKPPCPGPLPDPPVFRFSYPSYFSLPSFQVCPRKIWVESAREHGPRATSDLFPPETVCINPSYRYCSNGRNVANRLLSPSLFPGVCFFPLEYGVSVRFFPMKKLSPALIDARASLSAIFAPFLFQLPRAGFFNYSESLSC